SVPEPYWYFPEGLYVEKFDSVFNVEGNITADTAYHYYERQKLWHAIGNVKVVNLAGEKFETSELFLNRKEGRIYTDKFVRAERKGQIHTGYGLESNLKMTDWHILNHSGVYDIPDSTRTDQETDIRIEPAKQ
ncbi:MAG: LPS export ABC transporter periplasmic protein LptC, partial [Dysgonamonadaceae bacterium]|nr:LPS export ABC transporter periplasmic protein LptC [Dysgonamonadaceae bacterium]